ncbi:MAG: phosphoribosylglycinamide formyltransferase [Alphaproteobacteria bacterium]|nr:phosphoribosylglycinamide formyltransferase [Alphaproteobacteria bacterium]
MNASADKKRVAVLISGRGSNMKALVEASRASDYPAEITTVISNRPGAAGLAWAGQQGIDAVAVDHKAYPDRAAFDEKLGETLAAANVDIVVLAGFMRLMTAPLVERWKGRMINIHPSLLPLFPGLDTHARAIASGMKVAGCTVHFVTAEMDVGPIIAQAAVPIVPDDTPDTLAERIITVEHRIYPEAVRWVAQGSVRFDTAATAFYGRVNHQDHLLSPS